MEENDEVFTKEINQLESIDKSTNEAIKSMGYTWKKINEKLIKDNICFVCKLPLLRDDMKTFTIVSIPDDKLDNGVSGFIGICEQCSKEE
jgi:hypothetical protein